MDLKEIARLVRYHILTSTTKAGSGHPSSSLSAADLMTVLYFKYLRFDGTNPAHPNNDRVIFSKGHAAPLFYSLYAVAGVIEQEELMSLRKMGSRLQGHPTPAFPYAEAATGSLGQGLSVGVGMAMNGKCLDHLPYRVFVLLGDGEMAEGSVWEAIQLAAHYKLSNLIGILDVNRYGQSQETMYGHDTDAYVRRIAAFGWDVVSIDGHSMEEIDQAYQRALAQATDSHNRPKMIVARTLKGKGVSFLEDKEGWHGKAVPAADLEKALKEIGTLDPKRTEEIQKPEDRKLTVVPPIDVPSPNYKRGDLVATRKAYGTALARLVEKYPTIVSVDGDVKNSTFAEILAQKKPDHFFEMFIAEQNMVGVAVGLAQRGKVPFVSSFAAFLTRAFDQIRMAAVTGSSIKFAGSHVGVSIGEDGPSQMGLEDIAMFRSIHGSTVLYPSDAVSTEYLVEEAIRTPGIVYLRTSRPATAVLYDVGEKFPVGGSKVIRSSSKDRVTVIGAGVTLYEALKAYDLLQKEGISIRVIDAYSVKPIDFATLTRAADETKALIVVEDHWSEGGLGDAVLNIFAEKKTVPIRKLAVTQMPGSGKPEELVEAAGISANAIVRNVKEIIQ